MGFQYHWLCIIKLCRPCNLDVRVYNQWRTEGRPRSTKTFVPVSLCAICLAIDLTRYRRVISFLMPVNWIICLTREQRTSMAVAGIRLPRKWHCAFLESPCKCHMLIQFLA